MSKSSATSVPIGPAPAHELPCARLAAFCAPWIEVFQSVVYQPQIWQVDRFDVETIHAEARHKFASLLARSGDASPTTAGRLLMLHGEAGSGKTHLMRAFRGLTHADGAGYFSYLQMTTEAGNYGRYLLRNLVESLDQPYHPPFEEMPGLMRLSAAVLEAVPGMSATDRAALGDESATDPQAMVHEYADRLLNNPRLDQWRVDVDLLRAMLHLQRNDRAVKIKVVKWLRCEELSSYDRAALGDLVPRIREQDPLQMVAQIGRLMAAIQEAPLVVCVDQLEDMFNQEMAPDRFRRIVDTLVSLLDQVPNSVVVLSCLEDYYMANKQHLARSKVDRLERDPEPIRLMAHRTTEEIHALIGRRLETLYEEAGLTAGVQSSIYPYRPEHLRPLANLTTRDVLDNCRRHQDKCIATQTWIDPHFDLDTAAPKRTVPVRGPTGAETAEADAVTLQQIESAWNDFRGAHQGEVPEGEAELAQLLEWGIAHCGAELPTGVEFRAQTGGSLVRVERNRPGEGREAFVVAVCEKRAPGGALGRQVAEVERRAEGLPVVLVRSYPFPKDPRAIVSKQIMALLGTTGRRVEVENSDWRALLALRDFSASQGSRPGFGAWQQQGRPLSQLAAFRKILALDRLSLPNSAAKVPVPDSVKAGSPSASEASAAPAPAPHAAPTLAPQAAPAPEAPARHHETAITELSMGQTRSLHPSPVHISPIELKQHMAFLGGTGSGKTTVALNLIEQLLMQGVPAILIDRKGDLSRYADPDAWAAPTNPVDAERLSALRKRADVILYTPGASDGRPLAISVVPEGLDQLAGAEREQLIEYAASALGAMLDYRSKKEKVLLVILTKAIGVLAEAAGAEVTVDRLQELVHSMDPTLLQAVGGYEAKHFKRLAEDLLTLKLGHSRLLEAASESDRLDVDALLGRGDHSPAGKTRLSIISTQFLGSAAAVDFWVSQFLLALERWRTRSPSDQLQAVVLLDEADQYLPAIRQPATKAPLDSLLRRGRSAGLGFLLCTQSPGDFDYKCRENIRAWIIGRIKENTALTKLKPLFAETSLDVASKLPVQQVGEFYLLREREIVPLKADRSLIETRQVPEQRIRRLARGQ